MDFKDIKGVRHFLYDSIKEFKALKPDATIKGSWRTCEEGDWCLTDDEHVCQILKDRKGELKEHLFAKYVAKGSDVVSAFKKVYKGANNKSYISKKTNELLKKESVKMAIDKETELILNEEGVSPRWIIEKYKTIVDLSERDSDKLRSLEALAKMSGLFDTQTKKEQVTVWAGFSEEQQKVLNGGKKEIVGHIEKEEEEKAKD